MAASIHGSVKFDTTPQSAKNFRTMSEEDISVLIQRAIRAHELRVALWSGLLGAILLFGTWHAIWLVSN